MNMLYKIICMLSLLLLTPVLTARVGADTNIKHPIPFAIHTHGVALTEEDVRAVLDDAQAFLINDGVAISFDTSHSFDTNHNVIDDGKISGCDGITALLRKKDVDVHIVDDIPCCGDDTEKDHKIVGCSGFKMPMIVLPGSQSMLAGTLHLKAIQWMHELGHHMGLCHNVSDVGSIMNRVPIFTTDSLDACEQAVFNLEVASNRRCKPTCTRPQQ
jgi:hypothetical protein